MASFIFRCDPTATPKQFDFIRPGQTEPAGRGVYDDFRDRKLYLYIAWGGERPKTLARSPRGVAFTAKRVE